MDFRVACERGRAVGSETIGLNCPAIERSRFQSEGAPIVSMSSFRGISLLTITDISWGIREMMAELRTAWPNPCAGNVIDNRHEATFLKTINSVGAIMKRHVNTPADRVS